MQRSLAALGLALGLAACQSSSAAPEPQMEAMPMEAMMEMMMKNAQPSEGHAFLAELVEEAKASGFVGEAIARHGVEGRLSVAPPA